MLKKLMAGPIDALMSSPETIRGFVRSIGLSPKDVKLAFVFMKLQVYFAFSKGTPVATVRAWGHERAGMKRDGSFSYSYREYDASWPLQGPAKSHP